MKKSVRYHLLGALSALVALAFVLIWACMDEPQLVYEDGVYTVVYPFLTPALPYLAVCAFMLGCTCFAARVSSCHTWKNGRKLSVQIVRKALRKLLDKRAVSPAVSSVILATAVITLSFVVLAWAQYRVSFYHEQYGEAMDIDVARLKERLMFEYVFHNRSGNTLSVYLMNCGTVDKITIQTVYVETTIGALIQVNSNVTLMQFNGDEVADQNLDRGEEGYFTFSSPSLVTGTSYSVRIITGRGSTFDHVFIA